MLRRQTLSLAAPLLLAACQAAGPTSNPALPPSLPAGWQAEPSTQTLVYSPLSLRFPPTLSGLVRTEPATFDEEGSNVSIGYHGVSERIDLTLYIYPSSFGGVPDPEEHFKSAIGAALQLTPRGKLERAAPKALPVGTHEVPGYAALLHWPSTEGEVGSFLFLAPRGTRFVKLRATFLLDGSGTPLRRAADLSMQLLESLHIPAE